MNNKIIFLALFLGVLIVPLATQVSAKVDYNGNTNDFGINIYIDVDPPVVSDVGNFPENPDSLQTILINCTIVDDFSGVAEATLYYREVGASSYNTTTLYQVGTTDVYETTIGPYEAGFQVEYRIYVRDGADNDDTEDNGGLNYSFTVTAADETAPLISSISHSPVTPKDNENVEFSCEVTDASGVKSVIITYRVNSGSWEAENMTKTTGDTYIFTTATPFAYNALVEYKINATDLSIYENAFEDDNSGSFYSFTVAKNDEEGPTVTNIVIHPTNPVHSYGVNITCTVTDEYSDIGVVTLHYRINNGTWETLIFNFTGSGDVYMATFGPFNIGDVIDFYITATDTFEIPNEAIFDNEGDYYSFTVTENTELSSLFILLPIISIGALSIIYRRRK